MAEETRQHESEDHQQSGDQSEGSSQERSGEESKDQQGEKKDPNAKAREEFEEFASQDEVPSDPGQWPAGKAKYMTFGGSEDTSDEPYGEDETGKLGPSDVAHEPDGSVTVKGEKAEDPDEYKGEPIPGGPTDPDAPKLASERAAGEKAERKEGDQEE